MEIQIDSLDFDKIIIRDKNNDTTELSIQDDLRINEINLSKEMMEQSAKFSYWANLHEIVKRYHEAEQRKLETIGSHLNLQYRAQFEKNGKKPTKDMIDSSITIDQNYQDQARNVEDWAYKENQLKYVVKAFEQRMQMLISIGAEQRQTNKNGGITNQYSY